MKERSISTTDTIVTPKRILRAILVASALIPMAFGCVLGLFPAHDAISIARELILGAVAALLAPYALIAFVEFPFVIDKDVS